MKIEFQLLVAAAAAAVVCRLCGMKEGRGGRVQQSALCNYKSETRYGAFIPVTIHCAHRLSFALTWRPPLTTCVDLRFLAPTPTSTPAATVKYYECL